MDERARLTLPDFAYFLMSIAFLGALWPVLKAGLDERAGEMTTGEGYVYQLILPLLVIVLLVTIIHVSAGGGTQ